MKVSTIGYSATSYAGEEWIPPARCPRDRDGGDGPRACSILSCREHLHELGARGPVNLRRVRLMIASPDHCTLDVVDRATSEGVELTFAQIGELMGMSKEAARLAFVRAKKKVEKKLVRLGLANASK